VVQLDKSNIVSIYLDPKVDYPAETPFHPSIKYPEYPFNDFSSSDKPGNLVYHAVREALRLLGLDNDLYNTPDWNPFGSFIIPGTRIVIKPNAVWDINLNPKETVFASITHGSVLRAVIDYAFIALKGKGKIIIADCPLAHCDFVNWARITGIRDIVDYYNTCARFEIQVLDLRKLYVPWDFSSSYAPAHLREYSDRDPEGYLEVDLKNDSLFTELGDDLCKLFYGSDYNRELTVQHHINGHHKYLVARTLLNADTLISVPKLKVHSKVGVTLNIKGMVGTQGDKNYIPHYRIGIPARGGDEFPDQGWLQNTINRYRMWLLTRVLSKENSWSDRSYRALYTIQKINQRFADKLGRLKQGSQYVGNIVGGAWYGNDTAWRMALDLTRIMLYTDKEGRLQDSSQRGFFSVVDGIIGGEGEGPLAPTAKNCGAIISGCNPLAVDMVATRLMGFDPNKIKMLEQGQKQAWLNTWSSGGKRIQVMSDDLGYLDFWKSTSRFLEFTSSKGWRGHIEV
jgi:uncharacterized protein (DUF362 family)